MKLRALTIAAAILLLAVSAHAQSKGIAVTPAGPGSDERRVALVIGNADYQAGRLHNPVNDARAMAARLRALGFDVTEKENVSRLDLQVAIDDFGDRLRQGGVGLFYYSGHGAQFRGQNFLIPVDARLNSPRYAEYSSVAARRVLDDMRRAGNALNIVILDACRNDPFPSTTRGATRGLARMDAARGTLIAYATSPGETAEDGGGQHSPYTAAILRHLGDAGVPLEQVFKRVAREVDRNTGGQQTPWYTSSVLGDFSFAVAALVTSPPPILPGNSTFNLNDITSAAEQQEAARKAWAARLANMKQAAQQVEALEAQDITADLKVAAWQRFLAAFSEDDPYSTEDDALRAKATERLAYWRGRLHRRTEMSQSEKQQAIIRQDKQSDLRNLVTTWQPKVDEAVRLFERLTHSVADLKTLQRRIDDDQGRLVRLKARSAADVQTKAFAQQITDLKSDLQDSHQKLKARLPETEQDFLRYWKLREEISNDYAAFVRSDRYRHEPLDNHQRYFDKWKVVEFHHPRIDDLTARLATLSSIGSRLLAARKRAMETIHSNNNWATFPGEKP